VKCSLSQHARDVLKAREIPLEWVERVLVQPARVVPDRDDPQLEHRLGAIAEHGDRVLRVIITRGTVPPRVVTVFFDRGMKGRL